MNPGQEQWEVGDASPVLKLTMGTGQAQIRGADGWKGVWEVGVGSCLGLLEVSGSQPGSSRLSSLPSWLQSPRACVLHLGAKGGQGGCLNGRSLVWGGLLPEASSQAPGLSPQLSSARFVGADGFIFAL